MDDLIRRQDVLDEIVRFSTEEGSSVGCSQLYCDVYNMPNALRNKTNEELMMLESKEKYDEMMRARVVERITKWVKEEEYNAELKSD